MKRLWETFWNWLTATPETAMDLDQDDAGGSVVQLSSRQPIKRYTLCLQGASWQKLSSYATKYKGGSVVQAIGSAIKLWLIIVDAEARGAKILIKEKDGSTFQIVQNEKHQDT